MPKKKSGYDFEHALSELEQLVDKMENGELSLEQSLAAYEQGIKLTRECQQMLATAEQKVQVLSQTGELSDLDAAASTEDDE